MIFASFVASTSRDSRLRMGDFRVVYFVEARDVKVTEIFRRRKGYKWLD